MSREQIDEFLHQDAFCLSHLGPKPDCQEIRVPEMQSISTDWGI